MHLGDCQNYGPFLGNIKVILGLYGVIWGIMEKKMETTPHLKAGRRPKP